MAAMPTTTITKYKTIMVDPPWDMEQKNRTRGAFRRYGLMSLAQIKALPVSELAADNAHCWLWATNASLRHAYEVLEAWGFTPRSILTWIKPRIGLGQYLRNTTEHLLLGTRGNAPVNFKRQPSWMFAPLQEHSHKPEEQFAVIERISNPPYLELFARRPRFGWDVWGAEVASDIEIEGYPVPHYSAKHDYYMEQQYKQGSNDHQKRLGKMAAKQADTTEQNSCSTLPVKTTETKARGRYE
jgi:N6-adenosine-specific RNA methylase IME4